jgi:hypothetical protein
LTERIVIFGGYGVFGGRLARALSRASDIDVIVAGRSLEKAQAFCAQHGGSPVALDRQAPDLALRLADLTPSVVVDAAGPFQVYGDDPLVLARAAIACGAHYIDLSDDAAFTASIAGLDLAARERGVAVISGASSVPGLSSAAVDALSHDLDEILSIQSAILPGNRAPRGLSVVRAILAQTGQPLAIRRGGRSVAVPGWSDPRRETLRVTGAPPVRGRWTSFIGAPDLLLFPGHFGARSVAFRAGLELPVLHLGLWLLSFLVRWGILRSLEPLGRALRGIATLLEPFGTDRGGMVVCVVGRRPDGRCERQTWALVAESGDGPEVPALVARVLCRCALRGDLAPGARPCLGEASLTDVLDEAAGLKIRTSRSVEEVVPLFRQALGSSFDALPARVKSLHEIVDACRWEGRANVEAGGSLPARLIRRLVGFPSSGADIPVAVEIRRDGDTEIWIRDFGGKRFRSTMRLSGAPGERCITERFGPFRFEIALLPTSSGLGFPVARGWFLAVPLPGVVLPRSETRESEHAGAFTFDVSVCLPLVGQMVRYSGTLMSSEDTHQPADIPKALKA